MLLLDVEGIVLSTRFLSCSFLIFALALLCFRQSILFSCILAKLYSLLHLSKEMLHWFGNHGVEAEKREESS